MPPLLHIDRKSPEFVFAARAVAGESYPAICRDLGINAGTAQFWRIRLVEIIEKATGKTYAYPVCAFLVLLPPDERDAALFFASTPEIQAAKRAEFGLRVPVRGG